MTTRSAASATARVAMPAYGTRASLRPGWIAAVAVTTGAPSSLPRRRDARPGVARRPRARPRASSIWFASAVRTAALDAICSTARSSSGLLRRWSVTSAASLLSSVCSTSRRVRSSSSIEASAASISGAASVGLATRSITRCSASARASSSIWGEASSSSPVTASWERTRILLALPSEASRRAVRSGISARDAIRAGSVSRRTPTTAPRTPTTATPSATSRACARGRGAGFAGVTRSRGTRSLSPDDRSAGSRRCNARRFRGDGASPRRGEGRSPARREIILR